MAGSSSHWAVVQPEASTVRSAATIVEAAGNVGALPHDIKPVHPSFKVWGPAVTVATPSGDNLWVHRGLAAAGPGSVLVVSTGNGEPAGYWGEILSRAAVARGLGGVVLDGCARDAERLVDIGFPVFCRGLCIRGTTKDRAGAGSVGRHVNVGGVSVRPGDLVVGDVDGVVVVAAERVDQVLVSAGERDRKEAGIVEELLNGATTVEIFDLGVD
jgi:4-hydroxy-4-methyl-2-oxoglutarate aldolase